MKTARKLRDVREKKIEKRQRICVAKTHQAMRRNVMRKRKKEKR